MSASVLVTDGNERAALAVTRSLGHAGYRVHVCSPLRRCLAGASRFSVAQRRVPSALSEPDAFVSAVRDLVDEWNIGTLLPIAEPSLLGILAHRSAPGFRDLCIPFPELESFRRVSDRSILLQIAPEAGIAVPPEWTIHAPEKLELLDPAELEFPMVIKPARSVVEGPSGREKLSVVHARDWTECRTRLRSFRPEAFPLLLQNRVVGPGTGVFVLLWDDDVRAVFAHRRIREKPPSGGVSVYRESVVADRELVERSVGLLRRFGWQGVAMVEFKVEDRTGVPYLMEVNGRFWGSLQLAIDSGVDFPRLLLDAAAGRPFPAVTSYRLGIRSRWWWGDFDHLLARFRKSPAELSLPENEPGRLRAAADFLKLWSPGDRSEVLRVSDPRPFLRESVDWVLRR